MTLTALTSPVARRHGAHWLRTAALTAALSAVGMHTAMAADKALASVVARTAQGVEVTADDLRADAMRIPAEVRPSLLAKPQNLQQMADELLLRRVIASNAVDVDKDPKVKALLRIAHEKIISDAWLAQLDDRHTPTAAAAEEMARHIYQAEAEKRFMQDEQVRARHILVMGANEESKQKAQQLLDQLAQGADFAELAKSSSHDTGSGPRGGDLDFFTKGRMVPEFEEAAFALKNGERSGLVQSQFGWHIIERTDSKPAGVQPYSEVRDALIQEVTVKAQREGRAEVVQKIRAAQKLEQEALDALAKEFAAGAAQ